MISKDVASIIAKYYIPPVYLLSNDVGFKKYIVIDDVEEYTKYLFNNRHSTQPQFSWVYDWFRNGYGVGYGLYLNVSDKMSFGPSYNDYDQFKHQLLRYLQRIDIDLFKK